MIFPNFPKYIIIKKSPGYIHQLGDFFLRHLGELKVEFSGNQAVTQGQGYGLGAAGDTEFGKDIADMGFYSRWTDGQFPGNLGIVQSFNHQGQHFKLALR